MAKKLQDAVKLHKNKKSKSLKANKKSRNDAQSFTPNKTQSIQPEDKK